MPRPTLAWSERRQHRLKQLSLAATSGAQGIAKATSGRGAHAVSAGVLRARPRRRPVWVYMVGLKSEYQHFYPSTIYKLQLRGISVPAYAGERESGRWLGHQGQSTGDSIFLLMRAAS